MNLPLAFFSFPGGPEWIVILIVALLIFGPRLPKLMRSIGRSVSALKKGVREGEKELETSELDEDETPGKSESEDKPR